MIGALILILTDDNEDQRPITMNNVPVMEKSLLLLISSTQLIDSIA